MQPRSQTDDITTILGRFHTWAGKNPAAGNGGTATPAPDPGVREIPYEEAMQTFRERERAQTRRAVPRLATGVAATSGTVAKPAAITPVAENRAPSPATTDPDLAATAAKEIQSCELAPLPAPTRRKAGAVTKKASTRKPIEAADQARARQAAPATPVRAAQPRSAGRQKPPRSASSPSVAASAHSLRPAKAKAPAFKNALTKAMTKTGGTTSSGRRLAASSQKAAPAPDRNRRITTRFSSSEERRLERAAGLAGLSISAYLRQCALAAEPAPAAEAPLPAPVKRKAKKSPQAPAASASNLFSTPAASPLGNWLTLLRQRFLASPARFSERA